VSLRKNENLYYICYIIGVIKIDKYSFFKRNINIVCYNIKVKNIYTLNQNQNKFNQNFMKTIVKKKIE